MQHVALSIANGYGMNTPRLRLLRSLHHAVVVLVDKLVGVLEVRRRHPVVLGWRVADPLELVEELTFPTRYIPKHARVNN